MKKLRYIIPALIIALAVGSLVIGFAQQGKRSQADGRMERGGPPPPPGGPRGGLHPHMLERLNLSDAQTEQARALHEKARTDSEKYFEQLKSADEQLKTVVQAASFNEEQARQLLSDKAKAMTELEIIRLRTDSAIYNLLTAEQKTSLAQIEQERPDFHRRGRGPEGGAQRN